ncbi:MAG: serine protease [Gemmataceae bacterium]|nr:serine protease [Gemmataceae bacterium]MDW8242714.1 serine protease [Thermogemmata sp.]
MTHRLLLLLLLIIVAAGTWAAHEPPPSSSLPAQPLSTLPSSPALSDRPSEPWFVDDERFYEQFMKQLTALAERGTCLSTQKIQAQLQRSGPVRVSGVSVWPTSPASLLTPEEVYRRALPAVFVVGSVYKDDEGQWTDGMYATAWAATADGILVTSWHLFSDLRPDEVFAAADYRGRVYPLVEILGGSKIADVVFFRIAAKGLSALPLSRDYAPVGSWVGVLGHPGDNFYVFTTGNVTRYSTNRNDDGQLERWMGLTADYAGGSSGSPVLDRRGAVVGMAALTLTLDDGGGLPPPRPQRRPPRASRCAGDGSRDPVHLFHLTAASRFRRLTPPDKDKPPRPDPPAEPNRPPHPPAVQMILKMAVPAPDIVRLIAQP